MMTINFHEGQEDELIFVIRVARNTVEARADLGTYTRAVADFEFSDLRTNAHDLASNLMSWNKRLFPEQ